jgi:hypothetical protein
MFVVKMGSITWHLDLHSCTVALELKEQNCGSYSFSIRKALIEI